MDVAESTHDPAIRTRNLTFVVVGGGYAGIEALGELEDMSRYATRYYRTIKPADLRWVLVEASDRILPEVGVGHGPLRLGGAEEPWDRLPPGDPPRLGGGWARRALRRHRAGHGDPCLDRRRQAEPARGQTGFRLDERGRLLGRATLQVADFDDAWISGDAGAVPDLASGPGTWTSPSAQHAVRQAKVLADNIIASLRGFPVKEYRHKHVGSVASLGLYKGVAQVYGIKLKGFPAWFMHRTYHMSRMPTFARKAQVLMDWTQAFFFRREIVSLWGMHDPFHEFQEAAETTPAVAAPMAESDGEGERSPDRALELRAVTRQARGARAGQPSLLGHEVAVAVEAGRGRSLDADAVLVTGVYGAGKSTSSLISVRCSGATGSTTACSMSTGWAGSQCETRASQRRVVLELM